MFALPGQRRSAGMILMLSVAAAPGLAAGGRTDSPDDYAHAVPVSVSGKQAVVQLQLPRAVYFEARSNDLRDVRLFDSAGMPMPFSLVERVQQEQVSKSTAPAAIFAVRAPAGARPGLPDGLEIRTREDGAVISVTAPAARDTRDELASLVLDIQPPAPAANANGRHNERPAVSALALSLPPGLDSYNARLALDTSDDLQHWEPLTEAPVSWLVNSQGAAVRKDRIAFAPRPFRYARIAWLEGKPLEFAAITAELVTSRSAPQQRESVVLSAAPGKAGDDLVYAAPLAIPVQAVGLVFHVQNVVLPAQIGQYREQAAPKRTGDLEAVASATFYRLVQNGQERVSGEVEVPLTHAAQWVLRPQAKLLDRPELRLLWTPATIVFVAGGKGPYTLAFGRDGVQPAYQPLAQVAPGFSPSELAALEQARAGTPLRQHERAGSAGAANRLTDVFQRHEFWLWALLLCGVTALALMAWHLTRQLKDDSSNQPPA